MASQSLYRKWRSQTFNDLVGQEPIIDTLKNALRSGNLRHAYLFTGPRGTGKTSTARLLAKTINCLNPKDGEPCNECQQCREITAGNSFNVIEIDAASNRGIDSIRDLREKVMMPPSTGKYKVYVLDEAHMLTTEAFNALLKTLEEPPNYAVFVLATTEVQKMLPTVISRCQCFYFKRITTRQIVDHLRFIAQQEQVTLESGTAELLARAAAGGMRDALSLLDQAIAYAGSEIALTQVQAMLGVADPRAIQKFISHIAQLDTSGGLRLIHELSEAGADLRQINAQIVEYWRGLMLAKAGADVATILDRTEDEIREIVEAAQPFTLEELTECARVFAQNDLIQKNQGTPQLALELAFLACVELHRRAHSGQPLSASIAPAVQPRLAAHPMQQAAAQLVRSQPPASPAQPVSRPSPAPPPIPEPVKPPEESAESVHEYEEYDDTADFSEEPKPPLAQQGTPAPAPAANVPVSGQSSEMFAELGPRAQPVQEEASQSGLTLQQVKERWGVVQQRVKQKNRQTAAILNHYTVVSVENTGEEAVVMIQALNEVFYKMLNQGDRPKHVEWGLSMEFQQKCKVRLLRSDEPLPTPPARPANPGNNGGGSTVSTPSSWPQQQTQSAPAAAPDVPTTSAPPPAKKKPLSQENTSEQMHIAQTADEVHTPMVPLARKNIVRENSNAISAAAAQAMLEQKAKNHPVVQEIMRTFTVKNVQVNPK